MMSTDPRLALSPDERSHLRDRARNTVKRVWADLRDSRPLGPNAMTLDLTHITVGELADMLRGWQDHGFHPWTAEGDERRREVARQLRFRNWCVRNGRLSEWGGCGG